ncbi:MAG: hypothetical protein HPY76_07270 [Anaerolineae bacterium]|nr:hypothetical protein [Anaerolineae bacterium]
MENKEPTEKATEGVTPEGKQGLTSIPEVRILLYIVPVVTVLLIVALLLSQ